jgi:streptothricin acetyltransferase
MNSTEIIALPLNQPTLEQYAQIPISFEVKSILDVTMIDDGLGGMVFHRRDVERPYVKNYDSHEMPVQWLEKFDTRHWRLFYAREGKRNIGGLVLACKTPGVYMLEGRDDLAVVWDIRVLPEYRRKGTGSLLFRQAIDWAGENHCTQLKVETQNTNLAACEFYIKQGCRLGGLNSHAYRGNPVTKDSVQLLWYLDL